MSRPCSRRDVEVWSPALHQAQVNTQRAARTQEEQEQDLIIPEVCTRGHRSCPQIKDKSHTLSGNTGLC